MVRLTLDEIRDFETADYRVGVPLTYGIDNWQFKFAVYHLSSHLGDEFAIANPGSLADRINYVRDRIVLGASYLPASAGCGCTPKPATRSTPTAAPSPGNSNSAPSCRSPVRPARTARRSSPSTRHLREELDFGGDINTQAGWLWRGNRAR